MVAGDVVGSRLCMCRRDRADARVRKPGASAIRQRRTANQDFTCPARAGMTPSRSIATTSRRRCSRARGDDPHRLLTVSEAAKVLPRARG